MHGASKTATVLLYEIISLLVFFSLPPSGHAIENAKTDSKAEACSEVDLASPGGSIDGIQSGEQAFGTCAYHAAAVLFDAERVRRGDRSPQNLTSAIVTAYEMKKANHELDFEGGQTEKALEHLLASGGCRRKPVGDLKKSEFFLKEKKEEEARKIQHEKWMATNDAYIADTERWLKMAHQAQASGKNALSELPPPPEPPQELPQKPLKTSQADKVEEEAETIIYNKLNWSSDKQDTREAFLNIVHAIAVSHGQARLTAKSLSVHDSISRVESTQIGVCSRAMETLPKANLEELQKLFFGRRYLQFAEKALDLNCEEKDRLRLQSPPKVKTVKNLDFFNSLFGISTTERKKGKFETLGIKIGSMLSGESNPENKEEIERIPAIKIQQMINDRLDKGKHSRPFAIGYCSTSTENKIAYPKSVSAECGQHAAVISGRRKDPQSGRCQLKLQSAGFTEWIDFNDLIPNLMSITWLE